MTVAGALNLAAWVLSALIAGWLLFDVIRVARQHDDKQLINMPETADGTVDAVVVDGSAGEQPEHTGKEAR